MTVEPGSGSKVVGTNVGVGANGVVVSKTVVVVVTGGSAEPASALAASSSLGRSAVGTMTPT